MVTVIDILTVSMNQGQFTQLDLPPRVGQHRDLPGARDVSSHSHSEDELITSVLPGQDTGAGLAGVRPGALLALIAVETMLMGMDIMASVKTLVLGAGAPRHPGSG